MKIGGLFSGVGGFELAWTQLGHEVAWMCEIDKNARKVLAQRFPGVPIYEDVEQMDPRKVEPVDVLTGGSPCQGFSIAGHRSGMQHGQSRLFSDYVRIMEGLADRGLQWALWENVPGVLSIQNDDGQRTFQHVVAALAGGAEPVSLDPKRKWNAGLASGQDRAVAWRVLDSRHFGVPQRRRRIFAGVAFGDSAEDRAGRALLAFPEGVSRDPAPSNKKRQTTTGSASNGARNEGVTGAVSAKWAKGTGGPSGDEAYNLVTDLPLAFRKSGRAQSATDAESWVEDGQANTLNVFDVGDSRSTHAIIESSDYSPRRLTPVECERLQSFPDGWSEPAGSDSARYKAMGNAVTVNVVRWILARMVTV